MFQKISHKIFVGLLALLLSGCIVAPRTTVAAPTVPVELAAPVMDQVAQVVTGQGVQIYQCQRNKEDATKLEWTFVAPEAMLYDSAGNVMGKHYAGPTWEGNDGSKVVGMVKERANAPIPGAIPWLLLTAKSHAGAGVFSKISSIQRVATKGGVAPKANCDQAHQNEEVRVPYTATYYFYQP